MIVAVTAGKGGPGATFVATVLADAIAQRGHRTLLLDIDPGGGDVGAYLEPESLDPRRGLLPLLRLQRDDISPDSLARETQEVRSNLWVLFGMPRPAPDLLNGRPRDVLRAARQLGDVVAADLGRVGPGSPCLSVATDADRIVVVARPDPQGALAAERALFALKDTSKVSIVANRVARRRGADVVELSEALGRPVVCSLPEIRDGRAGRSRAALRERRALGRLFKELGIRQPPSPDATKPEFQGMAVS